MKEYLIISPSGKTPLFKEWIQGNDIPNFDLVLLFYDDDIELAQEYTQYTPYVFMGKGEKWHLVKSFIKSNKDFISQYKYIWFPCDDISLDTKNINKLFNIAKEYNLQLCQPALKPVYYSHQITLPVPGNLLRFTNFVEIMAPMFDIESLLKLYHTFDLIRSGWGYDYLWPYLLGYPQNKISIIDDIIMEHTKPVGETYSRERFPVPPHEEMNNLLHQYKISPIQINYSFIKK